MDLSNLWSNLPDSRPGSKEFVDEMNRILASEFKNAAKSVTALYNVKDREKEPQTQAFAKAAKSVASLYRLSHASNEVNHLNGYSSCLDDLLMIISEGGDVENWALTKRAEINKNRKDGIDGDKKEQEHEHEHEHYGRDGNDIHESHGGSSPVSAEFQLPNDYEFYLGDELIAPFQFRQSMPPSSVTHTQRQKNNWACIKKERDALKKIDVKGKDSKKGDLKKGDAKKGEKKGEKKHRDDKESKLESKLDKFDKFDEDESRKRKNDKERGRKRKEQRKE